MKRIAIAETHREVSGECVHGKPKDSNSGGGITDARVDLTNKHIETDIKHFKIHRPGENRVAAVEHIVGNIENPNRRKVNIQWNGAG